jgi:hypothetical protein
VDAELRGIRSRLSGGFVRDMLVSGVLPWVCVMVLQRLHVPLVQALAVSTIFPIADGVYSLVRERRIDAIGIVNLCFLGGSIALTLWTGDVHVALLKGIALTGIFSLVCLGRLGPGLLARSRRADRARVLLAGADRRRDRPADHLRRPGGAGGLDDRLRFRDAAEVCRLFTRTGRCGLTSP